MLPKDRPRLSDPFQFDLETPELREQSVRNDLLERLKGVCKDMPDEEFQDLVAAMTREQLRSERRSGL